MQRYERDAQRLVRETCPERERVSHNDTVSTGRFPLDVLVHRRRAVTDDGCEDPESSELAPEPRVGSGPVELLGRSDRKERHADPLEQWREVGVGGEGDGMSAVP